MQIAEVIRCVARRVHGLQTKFVGSQHIAVGKNSVGAKGLVLVLAIGRWHAQNFGAGLSRQQAHSRRMIGVRMRHQYPANRAGRLGYDIVDMRRHGRPRVQNRNLFFT